jgi:hypothetical protein
MSCTADFESEHSLFTSALRVDPALRTVAHFAELVVWHFQRYCYEVEDIFVIFHVKMFHIKR